MQTNNTLVLPDGRTLGFAIYGDPAGVPVCYFHGGQESRLSSKFMDSVARLNGIKVIAPDRPGIGLSTFQPNRSFIDWATDVAALADQLGYQTFSVFGLSGGAPHVLACLKVIPERIEKASIVSGATPYNYKGSLKGMWFPVKLIHWFASMKSDKQLRKFIQNDFESLKEKPEKRLKQFQQYLPKPDKELMKSHPEYGWEFIEGSRESYVQGIDGVVQEWQLYVRDWEFEPADIEVPVTLWYGKNDKMAPFSRGDYYNRTLPETTYHLLENQGHFSLIRNHLKEILLDLKF